MRPPITCASPRATYSAWRRFERYQAVKSETLRLNTELARRDGDVIRLARTRLGMVPSPPNGVTYLKLPRTPASP